MQQVGLDRHGNVLDNLCGGEMPNPNFGTAD